MDGAKFSVENDTSFAVEAHNGPSSIVLRDLSLLTRKNHTMVLALVLVTKLPRHPSEAVS